MFPYHVLRHVHAQYLTLHYENDCGYDFTCMSYQALVVDNKTLTVSHSYLIPATWKEFEIPSKLSCHCNVPELYDVSAERTVLTAGKVASETPQPGSSSYSTAGNITNLYKFISKI